MHRRLGNATLSQLAFPGEGNPNFPWEKSHWDNTAVKKNRHMNLIVLSFAYSLTKCRRRLLGARKNSRIGERDDRGIDDWPKQTKVAAIWFGTRSFAEAGRRWRRSGTMAVAVGNKVEQDRNWNWETRSSTFPAVIIVWLIGFRNEHHTRFRSANHPAAPTNQNVTVQIPHQRPEMWSPCFLQKLRRGSEAKDWVIPGRKQTNKKTSCMFTDCASYQLQLHDTNFIH